MPESRAGQSDKQLAAIGEAGRLDSWKEIANFFRREVRTVQLWERHESLPVHRHQHRKLGTVYAYKPELIQWWKHRCSGKSNTPPLSPAGILPDPQIIPSLPQTPITVAVRQFESLGTHSADREAMDRLTEQVTTHLDRFMPRRLRVSCALAVAQRHAEGAMLDGVDGHSAVDYFLDGRVEDADAGMHIRLEITRVKDGGKIWSKNFDCVFDDRMPASADLAEQASRALFHHVLMSRHVVKTNTVNPAARYAYLRGRYLWSQRTTSSSMFHALDQFKLSTELDPNHAPAHSGLADCYAVLGWLGAVPRETAMREARKAALMALSLDGSLAEGHVSMGCVLFDFDWDWQGAERELLLGIELNPSYAQAYCWYGYVMTALGRRKEAMDAARIAQDMDPASPVVNLFLGNAFFYAGQYDDAIQQFQHVIEMQPQYALGHSAIGLAYAQAGEFNSAIAHLQFAVGRNSHDPNLQSMLAFAYAKAGMVTQARELLKSACLADASQHTASLDAAAAYAALGDRESAMDCLHAGFHQRNARMTKLKCDPRLAPLYGDPRFDALARQMRLM